MLTLQSEKCGPVLLSGQPDFEGEKNAYRSYDWKMVPGGDIHMQLQVRRNCQAELFTIRLDSDDQITFSESPWPYTLVFVFGYSITLYLSRSLKKEIHDRGGHLFHSIGSSYNIRFQKDRNYVIIFIHYAEEFVRRNLEETAQTIRTRWELQTPVFYYSRPKITGREVMELLTSLILSAPADLKEDFLDEELARAIFMDFLQEDGRSFQPSYLGARHFETFYKERDALIAHSLETYPISKLVNLASIHQVPLFRKRLRQLYDLNPRGFITEIRMACAMSLLKDPTLSIKEIADKTGFTSAFYFSRVFTNYFGVPPKHFHSKTIS